MGFGFHEAPRGMLSHWVVIRDGKIANYQCVVPSTWNAGPRAEDGAPGPYEAVARRQSGRRSRAAAGGAAHHPLLRPVPCLRRACARRGNRQGRHGDGGVGQTKTPSPQPSPQGERAAAPQPLRRRPFSPRGEGQDEGVLPPENTVMSSCMRAVVLGVGNILLSDEGIGVHAVRVLEERYELPPEVEVIDGGTSAMDCLDQIASVDLLLIADCVRGGREPGDAGPDRRGRGSACLFPTKISPHQVGLSDVLAALMLHGSAPARTVLIGAEPKSFSLGLEPTPELAAKLPAYRRRAGRGAYGGRIDHSCRAQRPAHRESEHMCIGIPMRVIESDGLMALCEDPGRATARERHADRWGRARRLGARPTLEMPCACSTRRKPRRSTRRSKP